MRFHANSHLFALLQLAELVASSFVYVAPTNIYTDHSAVGTSVMCECGTGCIDGSQVNQPGQCIGAYQPCLDSAMHCSKTAYPYYYGATYSHVGTDFCSTGCFQPHWIQATYLFKCYQCPMGSIAAAQGKCSSEAGATSCVACTDADEVLTGSFEQGYTCTSKNPACAPAAAKARKAIRGRSQNGSQLDDTAASALRKRAGAAPACAQPCPDGWKDQVGCVLANKGGDCKTNTAGLQLLMKGEGCCLDYVNVRGNPTVGIGHDSFVNEDQSSFVTPMSMYGVNQVFTSDVHAVERSVNKWDGADGLNANQLAALVNVGFNAGANALYHSKLHALVKQRNYDEMCKEMGTALVDPSDKVNLGRRKEAMALCQKETKVPSGCGA